MIKSTSRKRLQLFKQRMLEMMDVFEGTGQKGWMYIEVRASISLNATPCDKKSPPPN
jgi:hypothetical protein